MLQVAGIVIVVILYAMFVRFMAKQYQKDYNDLAKKDARAAEVMRQAYSNSLTHYF